MLVLMVVGFGLSTVAFGFSREFVLSVFLYGLIGAFDQVSVVMRQTIVQLGTPDELRGRVSAVNQVFVQASSQIGGMESGFAAASAARPSPWSAAASCHSSSRGWSACSCRPYGVTASR